MHLKAVLIWNFDDTVVSVLPEGEVPYNKNEAPAGTEHTYLAHEWKVLYNFVKGGNDFFVQSRENNCSSNFLKDFIQMSDIVCLVKDKNLTEKYKLSRPVVEEAFPDIEWGNRGG